MPLTVLVVDDSPTMRGMLRTALGRGGYQVVEATNGAEALGQLDGTPIDAILTDINMPRMDGLTFVRTLRQDARFARTPVLVLTTESAGEVKRAGKAAGATGWIVKPFEPEQLCSLISMVIRRTAQPGRQTGVPGPGTGQEP